MKFKSGREMFCLSSGQQRTYSEFKTPSLCPVMTCSQHCAIQRKNVHFTSYLPLKPPYFKYLNHGWGSLQKNPPKCSKHKIRAQRNTVPKMKKGMKEPKVLSSSINRALVGLGEMQRQGILVDEFLKKKKRRRRKEKIRQQALLITLFS